VSTLRLLLPPMLLLIWLLLVFVGGHRLGDSMARKELSAARRELGPEQDLRDCPEHHDQEEHDQQP
jgi:hypothetical protein